MCSHLYGLSQPNVSPHSTKIKSTLLIEKVKGNQEPKIYWRKSENGATLGCELSYVKSITKQPVIQI